MTKNKIVSLCLAAVLVVMAVAGATVAYFTDTDNETNTFAVGNVKIDLIEQQRGENGLVPFEQNKKLYPIVGSAQGEKDALGMPTAKNYVDKMVTIKNNTTAAPTLTFTAYAVQFDNVATAADAWTKANT